MNVENENIKAEYSKDSTGERLKKLFVTLFLKRRKHYVYTMQKF